MIISKWRLPSPSTNIKGLRKQMAEREVFFLRLSSRRTIPKKVKISAIKKQTLMIKLLPQTFSPIQVELKKMSKIQSTRKTAEDIGPMEEDDILMEYAMDQDTYMQDPEEQQYQVPRDRRVK